MSAAAFVFSCHDAITKYLAAKYPLGEIIFFRQLSSMVLLLVYIRLMHGFDCLRTQSISGQTLRAFFFVASTVLIALSVSVLPLATALAIVFSSPLVVAALSGPILGEHVGPRRWLAICAGFVGVLIIIRPTDASFSWLLLIPVVAASASASRDIVTRILQRTESTYAILIWSNIAILLVTPLTAIYGWTYFAAGDIAVVIVAGVLNTMAHFLTITALRFGDAALVTPFRYTALIWAALLGFAVWGDIPDQWTTTGAVIIVAAGIYLVSRESQIKSRSGS